MNFSNILPTHSDPNQEGPFGAFSGEHGWTSREWASIPPIPRYRESGSKMCCNSLQDLQAAVSKLINYLNVDPNISKLHVSAQDLFIILNSGYKWTKDNQVHDCTELALSNFLTPMQIRQWKALDFQKIYSSFPSVSEEGRKEMLDLFKEMEMEVNNAFLHQVGEARWYKLGNGWAGWDVMNPLAR